MNANIKSMNSGPVNARAVVLIPFSTGVIPEPSTGRRLSTSNILILIKATSKKTITVIGNIISNIRAIGFIPPLIR